MDNQLNRSEGDFEFCRISDKSKERERKNKHSQSSDI